MKDSKRTGISNSGETIEDTLRTEAQRILARTGRASHAKRSHFTANGRK